MRSSRPRLKTSVISKGIKIYTKIGHNIVEHPSELKVAIESSPPPEVFNELTM